jgi:pilus assembly protein CpaB
MRAVTIGVDAITGTAGLIWPGDHVDVLLTHQMDDPNRPVGRRIAAETVLVDVRVIAIDPQLVQGAAPGTADAKPAATVTLEVTSPESERVSVAGRLGKLSLVVRSARSPDEDGSPKSQPSITWAGDVSPALSGEPVIAPPISVVIRVFRGGADGQEYRF